LPFGFTDAKSSQRVTGKVHSDQSFSALRPQINVGSALHDSKQRLVRPAVGRAATLREWAYAGFTIDLIGATASHVFSGDPVAVAATPAIFLLLLAASYALKPRQTAAMSGRLGQTRALAA
jgi:hypothetical protein